MKNKNKQIASLLLGTYLCSCTMVPQYTQPQLPVSSEIAGLTTDDAASAESEKDAASIAWKDFFKSESLQENLQVLQRSRCHLHR